MQRAFNRFGVGARLAWIEDAHGKRRRTHMLSDAELIRFGQADVAYFEADDLGASWRLGNRVEPPAR